MIATLLLAAGSSSRMGDADKLMEDIDGMPILERLAREALAVGPVFVTVPEKDNTRRFALPKAAQVVPVVDADLGMSQSIRAGIAALPAACNGVIILPADMPDITRDDLRALKEAALQSGARCVRASTEDGQFGHPNYFAASEFPRFDTLDGDRGAAALFDGVEDETETVSLSGDRARLDLDTPEDWDAYRMR